jgi:hypothetical protein
MKLVSFIAKSLEETPGVPSSVRLQLLLVCVMTTVVPFGVWAVLSLKNGAMQDFPAGLVSFGTLLFGGASAAKVIQQRSE